LGRYASSGHRQAPSLVRRADGQIIQLTPILYAVLDAIDGTRGYEEVAAAAGSGLGRSLTSNDVSMLVDSKLRPLGVLQRADGTQPAVRKADPLLGLKLRKVITNPAATRSITAPFVGLFRPTVVLTFLAAFLLSTWWMLFERGVAQGLRQAFYEPELLLVVFALTVLSAGFHELGHAAACRYGGGTPGAMGVALYLVWPAFYTDVTDSYRMERRDRLRVDLGGIYFNAVFAVGAFGLWAATEWEALLLIIPMQALQIVRQLTPLVRLDGYHILADITGVPDLFAHIKPILLGLLPTRWGKPETKGLKLWVRFVVTLWVLLVVPLLAASLVMMMLFLPRLVATAWDSAGAQLVDFRAALGENETATAALSILSVVAIWIPVLSMGYMATRVLRRVVKRVGRATEGRPVRRTLAALLGAALLAVAVLAWWPHGQYRPIQPDERGTLADFIPNGSLLLEQLPASYADAGAATGSLAYLEQPQTSGLPAAANAVPAPDLPVPVPQPAPQSEGTLKATGSVEHEGLEVGGFEFNLPDAPAGGDNQALAVNYEDGTSIYDFALSLVFAEGGLIDEVNEAYALASCSNCAAIALAFQLIVILDDADVIVPQNLAAAVNAYCVECFTYAVAIQLVFTVDEPLSEATMLELGRIWGELEELQASAADIPLDELYLSLTEIEEEITQLLEPYTGPADDGATGEGTSASDPEGEATASDPAASGTNGSVSTSPSPTPSASAEPSPSASPSESPSPTADPSPSPEPSESPSP
jgi:putative peptide zinc metalloprotease protein